MISFPFSEDLGLFCGFLLGGKKREKKSHSIFGSSMCSLILLHQWSLAVFLLFSPVTLDGRPVDALINRTRRSVSHVQMMHDKNRSIHEFRRRTLLHDLLKDVNTGEQRAPPTQARTPSQTFSGNALHQKPPGATKDLNEKLSLDSEVPILPQETNKDVAYKDQPLKVPSKRKKKVRLGRRRDNEKKRWRVKVSRGTQNPA